MAKVAFLGLGVMGFPMAGHLAAKGHEVTVYNRTFAKAEASWPLAARCPAIGKPITPSPRNATLAIVPSREIRPVRGAAAIIEAKWGYARGGEVEARLRAGPLRSTFPQSMIGCVEGRRPRRRP